MPEKATLKRAKKSRREGKSPSTQAGEFVREEIHHVRAGKHGARSSKQAIAIGLSKARRAGVKVPKRKGAKASRTSGEARRAPSPKRAAASKKALKKEGRSAASSRSLSRHARSSAKKRSASSRSAAAKKAARTRARKRN